MPSSKCQTQNELWSFGAFFLFFVSFCFVLAFVSLLLVIMNSDFVIMGCVCLYVWRWWCWCVCVCLCVQTCVCFMLFCYILILFICQFVF